MENKPLDPWDRLPYSKCTTDAESTEAYVYQEVGAALTAWANVENGLSRLFSMFLIPPTENISRKGAAYWYTSVKLFGSYPSTAARLNAIRVCAEAFFFGNEIGLQEDKEYLKFSLKLIGLVEKFLARRNEIAHGIVVIEKLPQGISSHDLSMISTLQTPRFATKSADWVLGKNGYKYDLKQLRAYKTSFNDLSTELDHALTLLFSQYLSNDHNELPFAILAVSPDTSLTKYLQPLKSNLKNKLNLPKVQPQP